MSVGLCDGEDNGMASTDLEIYDSIPDAHRKQLVNVLHNPALKKTLYHAKNTHRYTWRASKAGVKGYGKSFSPLFDWLMARDKQEVLAVALSEKSPGSANKANDVMTRTRKFRWGLAGGALVVPPFLAAGFADNYGIDVDFGHWWWLNFGIIVAGQAIYGMTRGEKVPIVEMPTGRQSGELNLEDFNRFLRAKKVLKEPTANNPNPSIAQLVDWPDRVDGGREAVFLLPDDTAYTADDVIAMRATYAANLRIPLHQIEMKKGASEAEIIVWKGDTDPYAKPLGDHPLFQYTGTVSVFDGAMFAEDARGQVVRNAIVGTNSLWGGNPRKGKSTGARAYAATGVLDPYFLLDVFDGKGGGDWEDLREIACILDNSKIPQQAAHLHAHLEFLERWVDDRQEKMRTMPVPEGQRRSFKLTRHMHENGMPARMLIVDELQRHLADPEHGKAILAKLTELVKVGPAAGLHIMLITQRPDGNLGEKFVSLRAVMGTRVAYLVDGYESSDMILGTGMHKQGFSAQLLPKAGTCIIRPDADGDNLTDAVTKQARTFDMSEEVWEAVCKDGKRLREELGEQPEPEMPIKALPSQTDIPDKPRLSEEDRLLLCTVIELLEDQDDGPDGPHTATVSFLVGGVEGYEGQKGAQALGAKLKDMGLEPRVTRVGKVHYLDRAVALLEARG